MWLRQKIPAARKLPPPPHNFSNGPSLYDYLDMVSLNLIPGAMKDFVKLSTSIIQSTPDNSKLKENGKKFDWSGVQVIEGKIIYFTLLNQLICT